MYQQKGRRAWRPKSVEFEQVSSWQVELEVGCGGQAPHGRDLIKLKYGLEDGGWLLVEPRGSFGVGLWKDIKKEAQQLKQKCKLLLGAGSCIRFWEDRWWGESVVCLFPNIVCCSCFKRGHRGRGLGNHGGRRVEPEIY